VAFWRQAVASIAAGTPVWLGTWQGNHRISDCAAHEIAGAFL
jgi:hypothetical protein